MIKFSIEKELPNGRGRAGTIETEHGVIRTPAFIPVGTKATVKAVLPGTVRDDVGAQAVLSNTYHLYLQPGTEILKKAGGLGKFMNWQGPTFTDSGGFQAFSLAGGMSEHRAKIAKQSAFGLSKEGKKERESQDVRLEDETLSLATFDEDGVTFKSIIDGSTHKFTPEKSIRIQHDIGADIIFAFDECISPTESEERQKEAVERTTRWAQRCIDEHERLLKQEGAEGIGYRESQKGIVESQAKGFASLNPNPYTLNPGATTPSLFGIVQGGRSEKLRRQSAREIGAMGFDGFGIGGSFDKDDIGTAAGWVADELPKDKPRHLLGIGEPEDLILGIENGMDTFDCVAPTRLARNAAAYVRGRDGSDAAAAGFGRINLLNAEHVSNFGPIDAACDCSTCAHYGRAYLAHLFRAKEMLAATLVSVHNLRFLVRLAEEARQAIVDGRFDEFKKRHLG